MFFISSFRVRFFNFVITYNFKGIHSMDLKSYESMACHNKVAIVTGASSGIGKSVALKLGRLGCRLGLVARRIDELKLLSSTIQFKGGHATAISADVTSIDDMRRMIKTVEEAFGPVDIVVHSAGVMYYTLMKQCDIQQMERTIDVNCKGSVNVAHAYLASLSARSSSTNADRSGHLVFISSDAGIAAYPGLAVYAGSKHFLQGFCNSLRRELADDAALRRVRVSTVLPGDVATPLQGMSSDQEAVQKYSGMGKYEMLQAEDIANAVVYALSQPDYVAVNEILVQPREAPT